MSRLQRSVVGGRHRPRVLRELHDHLREESDHLVSRGWSREQAEIRAVIRAGPVELIVPGIQEAVALTRARSAVGTLLVVLLSIALFWETLMAWDPALDDGTPLPPLIQAVRLAGWSALFAGALILLWLGFASRRGMPSGRHVVFAQGVVLAAALGCAVLAIVITLQESSLAGWLVTITSTLLPLGAIAGWTLRNIATPRHCYRTP